MTFFGGSKKPASSSSSSSSSKKHASTTSVDDREDVRHHPHSEPSSPTKSSSSSRSPKKSSRPASYRDSRESKPSPSPRQSRLSRHATEPTSSSSRRNKFDTDTHPLNLPPEERKRYSELSNSAMSGSNSMDIDREPINGASSPPPSNPSAQTNFSVPIPNGTASHEDAPVPPPHKSNPSSPVPTPQDDADAYKAAGNRLFKDKNYAKAIEQYSKAVDLFPDSPTFLSNRAAAYMSNGQYDGALEDCSRAADLDPQNAKVLLRLARIYTGLGRPEEAMTTFGRINPPPSAKDTAPTKEMLHHIDAARKSLHEGTAGSMVLHALDMAERGLGPGVSKPRKWQLMRGEAYIAMGRENSLGEAQNIAMSLLRSNSQDPEALVLRGRVLYGQGENEKAIQFFRMAISCDPDFRDAVKWLRVVQKLDRMKEEGNVEFKAGRLQPAIEKYTQALEIDPANRNMNAKLLQNRAQCKIKLKQYDEAIADAERAVGLDPSYTKARKTKANALGQSGKWEDAINEWKSIQELDPEDRTIPKEVRRAELELKKSLRKDYYKIMGLEKDAGPDEIKKAYRKMAVKLHPDKNPGDPEAEAKFKDMQEAYETLSDPQKKAAYDNGDDLLDPSDMFGGGGMGGGMGGIDPEILFGMMGNQGGGFGGGGFRTAGGFPGGAGGFPSGGSFPGGASFNFNGAGRQRGADEDEDYTAEQEEEWEEAGADPWDDSSGEEKTAGGKLRSDFQGHQEAREELVDILRRYGTGLLAAVVLLTAQLVALGVVAVALVYVCNRYVGRRRKGAAK
ncbi:DnaJ subfamily C member 7 [Tolypocladium ophioglossoides CBS 100239]|uniref:DnaJ subfamily C member 7 n=1 Tax=Tolypocladium ophioglossoides (strain CBS 100239) TaxID=1163406 RepID=A0A0L0N1P5_TOLOC|nr:DnaJ subfamily C member 7 [Tolypocladium ophioglossoides CBS 100239]